MKISFALRSMFPYNSSTANLFRNFAFGLSENGCKVELTLLCGNSKENYEQFPKQTNFIGNIAFHYGVFKTRSNFIFLRIIDDLVSPVLASLNLLFSKQKPDIIILSDGYAYNFLPIIIIAKLLRINLFKYAVDFYDKKIIAHKWYFLPKYLFFLLQSNIIDKKLDGIICISNYLIDRYKQLGVANDKLLLIPNFTVLNEYKSEKRELFNSDIIRVGYSGAAPILNGVDDLIRSFAPIYKTNRKIELLIVGDVASGNSQLPQLKKLAKDLGVNNRVTFTGRVSSQDVLGYIKKCDILVLARKQSRFAEAGFPTKLGEYFSTGNPVLLTRVGDFPEYFKDKEEVVFAKPDDPESITIAINYLIKNPVERKRIGMNGYKWAKANLEYKNNARRVIKFINELG